MSYSAEAPPPGPDGYRRLCAGDPAPWFEQASGSSSCFRFDLAAGRYVVLCFLVSAAAPAAQRALSFVSRHRELFDDDKIAFFGVTIDWRDRCENRLRESLPGVRVFWDFDLNVCRRYGVVPVDAAPGLIPARRLWYVLDPTLRIMAVVPFERDGRDHATVLDLLQGLRPVDHFSGIGATPPISYLLNVFEIDLCRRLIDAFDAHGGQETGSMVQRGGETVPVHDHRHKRRADHYLTDEALIADVHARVRRRIAPEISKVFQFTAGRMERCLVGRYSAEEGGHFAPHRDNTTTLTARRRFAASINLNDDYDGGEIVFPEYGSGRYKPPAGAGVVFSCSLLHAASPVTRGSRYAFLPFFHEDAAERLLAARTSPGARTEGGREP
jgi:predicted 2-oxoglutarate/Fe(II)-dependent dioxygenase YbiX/peroxiredoxin